MNQRNPVHNVSSALDDAVAEHLLSVPGDDSLPRRPLPEECELVMFAQSFWGSGASSVEGETVIVIGPMNDACVYFSGRLAYHVPHPNRRFFLDVAAQLMAGIEDSARYEGRDDAETESMAYGIEMEISRLHAALRLGGRERAGLVAKLLRFYADRFARLAERSGRSQSNPIPAGLTRRKTWAGLQATRP